MSMKSRRAFSFVELLVVVAILMILAALMFPARPGNRRAHGTASLSNIKQISLSMLAYAKDYDDKFVIAGQWHSDDDDAYRRHPESWYMPWPGLVQSYLKNNSILTSPLKTQTQPFSGPGSNRCDNTRQCTLLYPTYGYNAVYLSAIETAAVAKPAEQVMLTEIWSRTENRFGAFSIGADKGYISLGTAEAPDGATDPGPGKPFGHLSWGDYHPTVIAQIPSFKEGRFTAGVTFRYTGDKTPIAFADGHVKMFTAQDLARGTDWVRGGTSPAKNLLNGKYMWDPKGR